MIEQDVLDSLRQKYLHVHPLIFHRSTERARDAGDLFDILESLPKDLPVIWDERKHRWVVTDDLTQSAQFEMPQ